MKSPQGKVAKFETQLEDYEGILPVTPEQAVSLNVLPSLYIPTDVEREEIARKLGTNMTAQPTSGPVVPPAGLQVPPPMPGSPVPPPMPQADPQVQMYFYIGGQNYGPYDYAICKQLKQNNQINEQTMAWQQGMAQWTPAGQVPELKGLFAPAMPAGMPPMPGVPGMPPMPPTM